MKPIAFHVDAAVLWPPAPGAPLPQPALLGPNERRRAGTAVRIALHVAAQAVAEAGADAAALASVFASAHGDLAIVDALCSTLATAPLALSPTRFHHSVHNAAAGYWAIATGSRAPSTALAAYDASFAAGLLEAACQCASDARPVLLVGVDTQAQGALASVNASRGLLGAALVLAPRAGPRTRWRATLQVQPGDAPAPDLSARPDLASNALADALAVLGAFAAAPRTTTLRLGPGLTLALHAEPA